MKNMRITAKELADLLRRQEKEENSRYVIEGTTTCACGWNGRVQPGAKGQRCPVCGENLT